MIYRGKRQRSEGGTATKKDTENGPITSEDTKNGNGSLRPRSGYLTRSTYATIVAVALSGHPKTALVLNSYKTSHPAIYGWIYLERDGFCEISTEPRGERETR